MNYLIGDLQGCFDSFEQLLNKIAFSPSRDRLYVLGDLVNRGPDSLKTLRLLRELEDAAVCLLGNHDLHVLGVHYGVRRVHKSDTLTELFEADDRLALLSWLRQQKLAIYDLGWLMVHAGVPPQWDLATTLAMAAEVEAQLRNEEQAPIFFQTLFGNQPDQWSETLESTERWRFTVNALTRLRFCADNGALDLQTKGPASKAPKDRLPWFHFPERKTSDIPIAFGHWSTLGFMSQAKLLALDTGCVWGGQLTAVRLDPPPPPATPDSPVFATVGEVIQVTCPCYQQSGKDH